MFDQRAPKPVSMVLRVLKKDKNVEGKGKVLYFYIILNIYPFEKKYRPLSDDVDLEELWKINLNELKSKKLMVS